MKLQAIGNILEAKWLTGYEHADVEIDFGYGCDLMSDVLAYVKNNVILITGLVHPQVIRTAEMLDIPAIVFVRGKKPSQEIVDLADGRDIALLCTNHSLFTASGILYSNGLLGEEITHDDITL